MGSVTPIGCSVPGCEREHTARGLCKLHYYRAKRTGSTGPAGALKAPKGSGSIDNRGYRTHGGGANRRMEHVAIVERAMGCRLPPGAQVHHVNGDRADNRPENLVVCPDMAYHALLHMRQRALDAGSPAHYRKCSFCQRYDDPANMVAGGVSQLRHRACYARYQQEKKRAAVDLQPA